MSSSQTSSATSSDPSRPGRIVLLGTTHRVAPGLLSWQAWQALHDAARVVTRNAQHPQRPHLEAAGVLVDIIDTGSDAALAVELVAAARTGSVVLLSGPEDDTGLAHALAAQLAAAAETGVPPEVEALPGSWDVPGARVLDLVAVMDRLRSPGGCPWDAAQTHASLLPYLVEETYEVVEAVETGDLDGLEEELGDLLLQVVFHARLGEEHPQRRWSVDDVAGGIVDKLVRRHPHVFDPAGQEAASAEQVDASWEVLKAEEKQRTSAVEGIPRGLPALTLATKLISRARKLGVAAPVGPPPQVSARDEQALGELLLGLVSAATETGVDAEAALRGAVRRYADRVRAVEAARRASAAVEDSADGSASGDLPA